jgi:ribosomal protein S18 acetylase RimI-like enzyme
LAEPSAALEIVRVGYGHPDAMRLIAEVQAEYVARYGGPDHTPLDPLMFEPPLGSFYVGYLELDDARPEVRALRGSQARTSGEPQRASKGPVASGAWRAHDDVEVFGTSRTAEVKRMYVAPDARARGIARTMLAHLERASVEAGAEAMILETGTAQPEAIALYESSGYAAMERFGHYAWAEGNRCYGRMLG